VAFVVADDYQGRGLGTILLGQLAEIASSNGIRVFAAEVLPADHDMIGVFRDSGFAVEVRTTAGELHVEFPTELGDEESGSCRRAGRSAAGARAASSHTGA
jgi:GNAT superfamily N-acetyltransferase